MKYLSMVLVLGLALVSPSTSPADTRSEDVFSRHEVPRFESARPLCWQRLYAPPSGEIARDVLTAPEPPEKLVAFYTELLGKDALTQDDQGWTWKLPAGSAEPKHFLSLYRTASEGPWKAACKEPIPSDTQTVILLSTPIWSKK